MLWCAQIPDLPARELVLGDVVELHTGAHQTPNSQHAVSAQPTHSPHAVSTQSACSLCAEAGRQEAHASMDFHADTASTQLACSVLKRAAQASETYDRYAWRGVSRVQKPEAGPAETSQCCA